MSLINKMLQDLDARGGAGDGTANSQAVKAVPVAERERRPLVLAVAWLAVAAGLAAGTWYGWQYWQRERGPEAPVPKVVIEQTPALAAARASAALETAQSVLAPAPMPEAIPAPAPSAPASQPPAKAALAPASAAPASEPAPAAPSMQAAMAPSDASRAAPSRPAHTPATASRPNSLSAPSAPASAAPDSAAGKPRRRDGDSAAAQAERKPAETQGVSRRELTPKVESDAAYRRALTALQEGRLSVAMADLERALEIDPRNEGARQTYVSLLLENKRVDDAIRQLRLALGIDPRQPALAMVLARLQLERGGPALATLTKSLPYAGGRADYFAFLAGVLQREQRHADAARYYRDALQLSPDNGVWWMGLGISLQAEQHLPEAREAYARARGSAGMTAELLAFIDRKLEQLAR